MTAAGLALLKLLLGLAAFAVLGYIGRFYDKRIAGVLLTFPILNGIGILTGADPLAVADSIYAVVVFNGLLLFLTISCCHILPPLSPACSATAKLVVRLIVWTAIWAVGATATILLRDHLPGAFGLLLIQTGIAAAAIVFIWKAPRHERVRRGGKHATLAQHLRAIVAFWSDAAGIMRIGLFAACCALLLAAANYTESKWIGMLSALPLPGLFAVATLSVLEKQEDFDLIRDSVLLGPVTVIAFNWLYAQVVFQLPAGAFAHTGLGIAAMVALLFADAALIFWIIPRISDYFDRARQ